MFVRGRIGLSVFVVADCYGCGCAAKREITKRPTAKTKRKIVPAFDGIGSGHSVSLHKEYLLHATSFLAEIAINIGGGTA